jgi:hypothetical protein
MYRTKRDVATRQKFALGARTYRHRSNPHFDGEIPMTNVHTLTLPTQNEAWGFWGTMGADARSAWPLAMHRIAAVTEQPLESVRIFLDSRFGRHFADGVQGRLGQGEALERAIDLTVEEWMSWRIKRAVKETHDVPQDLPYLYAFVAHCAIVQAAPDR